MPTNKRHYKITLADTYVAHDEALITGGRDGVLNLNLIQSAIGRPYSGYYRDINQKASALIQSLVQNHGFVDGNKRTALILTYTLLRRSGYELMSPATNGDIETEFENLILSLSSDKPPFENIVDWFKARIRKVG